jgi:hypothetical protein
MFNETLHEGISIEKLDLPKENQILVIKIDIEKYDIEVAAEIFENIKSMYPEDTKILGLPKDVVLNNLDVEEIDAVIEQLEIMKEQLK